MMGKTVIASFVFQELVLWIFNRFIYRFIYRLKMHIFHMVCTY